VTSFLRRLWTTLVACFRAVTKPQPDWGDLLNRFLTHRNQFSATRVKPGAFLPPPNLKLSVFCTGGLSGDQIWALGERYIAAHIYGRAELRIAAVSDIGLRVDLDNRPPRHANILGWPTQKSAQKLCALKLAEKSSLALKSKLTEDPE
jgi:hypothetical protein